MGFARYDEAAILMSFEELRAVGEDAGADLIERFPSADSWDWRPSSTSSSGTAPINIALIASPVPLHLVSGHQRNALPR
jgi:hypothetical protein